MSSGRSTACAHGTAVAAIPCLLSTLSLGSLEPIRVNLPYPGRLWRLARADGAGVHVARDTRWPQFVARAARPWACRTRQASDVRGRPTRAQRSFLAARV